MIWISVIGATSNASGDGTFRVLDPLDRVLHVLAT
jgi:hypothetical protein